jgi:hypothetical protein
MRVISWSKRGDGDVGGFEVFVPQVVMNGMRMSRYFMDASYLYGNR